MIAETAVIVSTIFTAIKEGRKLVDEANDATHLIRTKGSITKLLSTFIIEPVAIVSDDLKTHEQIDKILELNIDIFASYYMQAFRILADVQGLDARTTFDVLSTGAGGYGISSENMDDFDYLADLLSNSTVLAVEAKTKSSRGSKYAMVDNDNTSSLVHKELDMEITVSNNGESHTVVIPIFIKTNILFVKANSVVNMIAPKGIDNTLGSRIDAYRAGSITLTDLLFAGDLVKDYKDSRIKDKDKLMELVEARRSSANSKLATRGAMGFEKYYTLLVLSTDALTSVEHALKGKITKPKYKEILANATGALLTTVVDDDYERIAIHTKDISGVSDITFKSIAKRGSGNNNDMAEIFKALLSNRTPSF